MRTLQHLLTVLPITAVVLAIAPTIYLLGFAQITYTGVTVIASPGQPPVTTEFTRSERFVDKAGPVAIVFALALSSVAAFGAYSARRGWLLPAVAAAALSLIGAYITGFSIGLLYFPAVLTLALSAIILGFARLAGRSQ